MIRIERLDSKDVYKASKFAQSIMNSTSIYNKKCRQRDSKELSPDNLRKAMKYGVLFVAKNKDGKIIGFADYYPSDSGVVYLNWVFVDNSFRRKGLGTALLKRLLVSAKKHGEHSIWTEILADNYKSINLIKKIGFKKIGLFKKAWYKQDYYLWYKNI